MLRQLLLVLLAIGAVVGLPGQVPQHFAGLQRTRLVYLTSEVAALSPSADSAVLSLHLRPRQPLTAALKELRQELVNLPVITSADYRIDSSGGRVERVRWRIDEGRTIFPLLNIGGVRGNIHYLLGVQDINFRGRGQQLTAFYQNNDGEHNYYLALRNASYRGSRWGYELESRRYAAVEPVYFPSVAVNYRYANLSLGASVLYSTPNRHVFSFGLSSFYERYRLANPNEATPGPRELDLPKTLVKLSHRFGRPDWHWERLAGSDHQTQLQYVRNLQDRTAFAIAWHDFRYYRLVGYRGNLATRLRVGISSNEPSPFAPFVLDSQTNIRGSGNRIDRGTAQLILNLEYRHSVWRDRRERFATQLVAFSDIGSWRNPGGNLEDIFDGNNVRHFVGAGLRLISLRAFNAVLRIDYGVDVRNTRERGAVIGFGQYF